MVLSGIFRCFLGAFSSCFLGRGFFLLRAPASAFCFGTLRNTYEQQSEEDEEEQAQCRCRDRHSFRCANGGALERVRRLNGGLRKRKETVNALFQMRWLARI